MGNRLVTLVENKNGDTLAASYQHWSADDDDMFEGIINKEMKNFKRVITKYDAALLLLKSLEKFNNYTDMDGYDMYQQEIGLATDFFNKDDRLGVFPIPSIKSMAFLIAHPSFPNGKNRNNGLISIDEKIWKCWLDYAENILVIKV